jgi:NitT/TauT family transport system ATP-binding protein
MTTAAAIVEARGVSKSFRDDTGHDRLVLDAIDLAVGDGEIVCVLGPSGCGKSTLLRILLGLLEPTAGEVWAMGERLRGLHSSAALVFQSFALYPWLTVEANVRLALSGQDIDPKAAEARVADAIGLVGLDAFRRAYPKELSGGMKQRVGIARALAARPVLLGMDEPFSALDVLTAETLRAEVARLWAEGRTGLRAILMITHLIEDAVVLGDRIVVMGSNPGVVRAVVQNPLPRPRQPGTPAFEQLLHVLHDAICEVHLPDAAPPTVVTAPAGPLPLPDVRLGQVVGVLRLLAEHGGALDMFALDDLTLFPFGHTIAITKAAELLGLVETPGNRIALTADGRTLLGTDTEKSRRLLGERARQLPTFRWIEGLLARSPGGRLPRSFLEEEMAIRLPAERPTTQVRVLLDWGRRAGLLEYDPETGDVLAVVSP